MRPMNRRSNFVCYSWWRRLTASIFTKSRFQSLSSKDLRTVGPIFHSLCIAHHIHKGPNWREKVQWIKMVERKFPLGDCMISEYSREFICRYIQIGSSTESALTRSLVMHQNGNLYLYVCRCPLSTTAMHLSTVTSRLTIFSTSSFVLGFLRHRLHLWAHDSLVFFYLNRNPLVSETPENCYVSFFKCENGQSWRWAANRTYISPRRHWPRRFRWRTSEHRKKLISHIRSLLAAAVLIFFSSNLFFLLVLIQFESRKLQFVFFSSSVFFICFLYFVFVICAPSWHRIYRLGSSHMVDTQQC